MQENLPNNLLRSGKDCATIYMENGRLCVHIGCVLPRMPDGIPAGEPGNNARRKNYEKTFIGPAPVPGHGHRPGTGRAGEW